MDNELADVVLHHLQGYLKDHQLPSHKLRALDAILKCRTPYMGGHLEACEDCAQVRVAYNSCRNRHCSKCGAIDKEKWVVAREADLLQVGYFHVVFTVPDKLNSLFLNNQRQMYDLLFTTAWGVLKSFGADKKWIGGKMGATAILHTSGQRLNYHPHTHMIVPGGALMKNGKWKHARSRGKYLFNNKQMGRVFRVRFLSATRKLLATGKIEGKMPSGLFDEKWVVYAKRPFGGAQQVIKYLGRYTHRTAISNERILQVTPKEVTFTWKDYAKNYEQKTTSCSGEKFLGMFCQHILPPGFTRIRHYGFLSSAAKEKDLASIREDLGQAPLVTNTTGTWQEIVFERMAIQPGICKCCGGQMKLVHTIPDQFYKPKRAPPFPAPNQKSTHWNTAS